VRCPNCNARIDVHSSAVNPSSTTQPKEGDWGLCLYCHVAFTFDSEGNMVLPDPELEPPEDVEKVRHVMQQMKTPKPSERQ
jgi:hypothetical protein